VCSLEGKEVEQNVQKNPQRIHRILKINSHPYFVPRDEVLEKYQEYRKLIVTRNPYERVVSYYCNKIINRQSNLVLAGKMTNKNCQLHFHDFCQLLKKQRTKFALEHHAKPQYYNLDNIHFDWIVDLKQLNNLLPHIHAELGIEKDYPFLKLMGEKASKKKYNPTKYDLSFTKNVSLVKPKKFKNIPHYIHFFDDASRKVILNIYQDDFDKFGYSHKLGDENISSHFQLPRVNPVINVIQNTIEGETEDQVADSVIGSDTEELELNKVPSVSIFSSSQEIML
jgi:hypothetical protein